MLNELRSSEVASQYSVTQRDGLQRHPPLQIDNKDERPLVSKNNIDAVKDLNILTHKYHLSFLEPGFLLLGWGLSDKSSSTQNGSEDQ